jgi:hypothetical protein
MAQQHGAIVDHPADHRDMAQRHRAMRVKAHHRAHFGGAPAGIAALGLVPPGMRIAIERDARGFARKGHALAIGQRLGIVAVVALVGGRHDPRGARKGRVRRKRDRQRQRDGQFPSPVGLSPAGCVFGRSLHARFVNQGWLKRANALRLIKGVQPT